MTPKERNRRIWKAFDRARKNLKLAQGRAADDGMFAMRDAAYRLAVAELARAERAYNEKRAAWSRAGKPDRNGKRTTRKHAEAQHA